MPMDERTPLIQTIVVTRREPKYPHSTLQRFCTILLGCLVFVFGVLFVASFFLFDGQYRRFPLDHRRRHFPNHDSGYAKALSGATQGIDYEELASILISTPDERQVRDWNKYYSAGADLAGKNLSQALWTRTKWEEFGIKSEIVSYELYLNYPVDHRLALLKDGEVEYECNLEEDVLEQDPTTSLKDRVPTFHGYSASGNVTAQYVYVNFGSHSDYDDLVKANVSLEGKIAIAKYGGNFRGIKVKRAQELGMVGVVLYSDPQSDGEITEENGYKPYPEGPARNPSSVQRGSVQFLSTLPGDPTTPGYPSKPGVPRTDPKIAIPSIPSIPISYQEAIQLLKALNGHGPEASSFNENWQGGGLTYKGVNYNIGPSPADVTLNLYNEQQYVTTPIWNVIGIMNGTIPDEVIVIGCHRDAWIAGGAGDPHSGSSALMEVVRAFGQAQAAGWSPMRTIVIASWDGEEYGLLGSTEWVEEYLPWLSRSAVAYLNTDVAATGPTLRVAAAPILTTLINEITSIVPAPDNGTVYDNWSHQIESIGSGSDFTAFLDYAGISSLDIGYTTTTKDPVYHYHSNYDSFHWMDTYGDKTWKHHTTIAKLLALMAARISESPILPFNATQYSISLASYLKDLKSKASTAFPTHHSLFQNLDEATARLHRAAINFDARASDLTFQVQEKYPWYLYWKHLLAVYHARQTNNKYKDLERSFLHAEGLDHRSWFKHVVFAPGRYTGYSGALYPGLDESIEDENPENAMKWSRIIEEKLNVAAALLEG